MSVRDLVRAIRKRYGFRLVPKSRPKRRQRREGLSTFVVTAEQRVLLSGVAATDDTMLVERQDVTVQMDVLAKVLRTTKKHPSTSNR